VARAQIILPPVECEAGQPECPRACHGRSTRSVDLCQAFADERENHADGWLRCAACHAAERPVPEPTRCRCGGTVAVVDSPHGHTYPKRAVCGACDAKGPPAWTDEDALAGWARAGCAAERPVETHPAAAEQPAPTGEGTPTTTEEGR